MRFDPPPGGQSVFDGSDWGGQKVLWAAAPRYAGPVLIRGRELDGPQAVGFGGDRVPFDEMQLLAAGATSAGEPAGWREWPSYTRLRGGGCYAYQVDGANFSTVIVFAPPQHRNDRDCTRASTSSASDAGGAWPNHSACSGPDE
jgi:hypothetical protein